MSVIGEVLSVWSLQNLCNVTWNIGNTTKEELSGNPFFFTTWDEYKNMLTKDI